MQTRERLKGVEPPEVVRVAVKQLVDDRGEVQAMAHLGLSSQALARLAAGFSVQRATLAVARSRLGIELDSRG